MTGTFVIIDKIAVYCNYSEVYQFFIGANPGFDVRGGELLRIRIRKPDPDAKLAVNLDLFILKNIWEGRCNPA